jgi:ribosome biogenesis protein BMS1
MPRRFNPLFVPKRLQKDLPFKSKPKLQTKRKKPSLETKRAVVMEPDEKRVSAVVNMLSGIFLQGYMQGRRYIRFNAQTK